MDPMSAEPDFDSEEQRLLCHLYQVLCADLPSCGCNDPQAAHKLVHDLVSLAPFYENERWRKAEQLVGSEGAFQIVISALNDAELLEHGGSMGGSWLGKRGRWFLWAVEQVGGIEGLVEKLDGVGYPHGWDSEAKALRPCEDSCWVVPDDWQPHINQPGRQSDPASEPGTCVRCLYGTPHQHAKAKA